LPLPFPITAMFGFILVFNRRARKISQRAQRVVLLLSARGGGVPFLSELVRR